MDRPRGEDIASGRQPSSSMGLSIRRVTNATFVLRFATGLTGALLIFLLADFPQYGGSEISAFTIGVLTALFYAAELILSPPFGLLSDRVGHHRVMQIGPVFGLVAVVLTALVAEVELGPLLVAVPVLVGSLPLLALTRLLEGASTAASVPSALGYVAVATSGNEALRGRASSRFEGATIAGLALGFAAAGPLWTVLGPVAFLANAVVYAIALGLFRWRVPDVQASASAPLRAQGGWQRYRRLLGVSRVWLLAPTWIALNAGLGLYTSQTLFQLVRTPDPRFADQALVGGFDPLLVTLAFVAGGAVFFVGLAFWGRRFTAMRRTTMIFYGVAGGVLFVFAALALNHSGEAPMAFIVLTAAGLGVGLFLIAGATPAALGLLADVSESFPDDRGAVMGLYSVFLALGQITGALIGAAAAEAYAFDGILMATLALQGVALLPLARLRRFELLFQATPASDPDPETVVVDLAVTRAYRVEAPEPSGEADPG
ncbi:MAG: MFS transporter [Chloroflexota bacterium]|jgi:MFS family permease